VSEARNEEHAKSERRVAEERIEVERHMAGEWERRVAEVRNEEHIKMARVFGSVTGGVSLTFADVRSFIQIPPRPPNLLPFPLAIATCPCIDDTDG
jgi:hypothetical protein